MKISKRITPEVIAAAAEILKPYCKEISATNLVDAIQGHGSDIAKLQSLHPFLTRKGVATATGLPITTVNEMVDRGELPAVKIGSRLVYISITAVDSILNGVKINGGK